MSKMVWMRMGLNSRFGRAGMGIITRCGLRGLKVMRVLDFIFNGPVGRGRGALI
jgi:hypothetical protein